MAGAVTAAEGRWVATLLSFVFGHHDKYTIETLERACVRLAASGKVPDWAPEDVYKETKGPNG